MCYSKQVERKQKMLDMFQRFSARFRYGRRGGVRLLPSTGDRNSSTE
jgi:hypothetical protein